MDSTGNIRGYINEALLNEPFNNISDMSIQELIGDRGCIQVMKDLGMNSTFTGITDMPYGNIVDDFSYYFKQSEQTDSFFSINIVYNENAEIILSRGIMVQLLPGAHIGLVDIIKEIISENQSVLSSLRDNDNFKEIPYLLFKDIEAYKLGYSWSQINSLIQSEMKKGTPADNPGVLELARRWKAGMDFFTGGDAGFTQSAERYYADNPHAAKGSGMSGELYKYIKEAMSNIKKE